MIEPKDFGRELVEAHLRLGCECIERRGSGAADARMRAHRVASVFERLPIEQLWWASGGGDDLVSRLKGELSVVLLEGMGKGIEG